MAKVHISPKSLRKRKRGERIFQFESFCEPGHPTHFTSPFHENIRSLLEFGNPEANTRGGVRSWSFQLEVHHHHPAFVRLFVTEEEVGMSLYRHCQYCRYIGWGHHMISNKRFHFVLPSKETPLDVGGWSYEANGKGSDKANSGSILMDIKDHLMHGIIHSNGFGHLICINGIEGGSEFISGHHILDFWDRICKALQLRKVSLIDVARKGTMELRLIHGVAYGQPWFGQWGYKFGHGSYGVTQQTYQKSLQALQALPLCLLIPHFTSSGHEIPMIVAKYQTICGHSLLTLGDLIRFMIELKARVPPNSLTAMDHHGLITETSCRWSMKRVEMAAQVIVEALKKSEFRWVTRQEVRDAARAYIGDTGLLDYVLKSLGNHIVGNYIVRREVNPVTKVLEYCLEDISNSFRDLDGLASIDHGNMGVRFQITRVQLMKDILYLYNHILKEQRPAMTTGIFGAIPMAVRAVVDTKHLVKDYKQVLPRNSQVRNDDHMKLMCTVRLRNEMNMEEYATKELLPYEMITIAGNSTVGELKKEVERYFREMYWGLKSFEVESIVSFNGDDSDLILKLNGPGTSIVFEGRISEGGGCEMYEGRNNNGVVDCHCGAKEEDGERMVCCDICEVWQHTRCVRIPNSDEIPRVFLCRQCENDIDVAFPSIHY